MSTEVRWGILGSAGIAAKVCVAIAEASNARVVAVASREKSKAEAFIEANCKGAKAYGSYQELLDDEEVQVVYLPLPTGLRVEWVLKAAAKKKHVLSEKPIAPNARDAVRILEACQAAGVQFMDNTMFMHSDRLASMRKVLDDEELFGKPRHVCSTFSLPLANEDDWASGNIRMKRALEPLGSLGDLGWYSARLSLWAFGYEEPEAVSCRFLDETAEGVPIHAVATLRFSEGRTATFDCSFKLAWRDWADVVGTKSALRVEDFVVCAEKDVCSYKVITGSCGEKALTFPMDVVRTEEFRGKAQHTLLVEKMSSIAASGELEEFWPNVSKQTQLLLGALVSSARQNGSWVTPREPAPLKGKGKGAEQADVVLKKPTFVTVSSINPDSKGLNLEVKVVSVEEGTGGACSAVMGDATGVFTFLAKGDDQVGFLKKDASLILRNAAVRMVKGFIRVQVDKWGKLEGSEAAFDFTPNTERDVSSTEYELVES